MTQRDIPRSRSLSASSVWKTSKPRRGDDNTLGSAGSQADSDRISYYSRGFEIDNYGRLTVFNVYFGVPLESGRCATDTALYERGGGSRRDGLMTGPVILLPH